jgi:membrane-anchored mycosin MYCP
VVSGLAALIRARFPALTARQVMQRIESTAHHPPARWAPLVGNGTIDALAAVSTDSVPPSATAKPQAMPAPTAAPRRPDRHARNTAFVGAAVCLAVLLAALAAGAATRRLGRSRRDDVPGD